MAYRRRQGITRASTFKEEIHYSSPSNENHDDFTSSSSSSASSSLAAQAIRASAAHRESSLSSAYGGSALASRDRDSEAHRSKSFAAYGGSSVTNESKSGFWGVLARKAKAILEEENISEEFEKPNRMKPLADDSSTQGQFSEGFRRMDNPTLRKGLDRITSSLNQIGDTFEKAFEEGRTIVENKTADIKQQIRRKGNASDAQNQAPGMNSSWGQQAQPLNQINHETQLKASRDVAMATAAKAKLLLRELKTVKADLAFAKLRCSQLEEENKILREGKEKGGNAADDDLIRLQLETLLAEKSRLANENATYARENRFLREIVEYHQLTMQDVVYLDEGIEEVTEVYPIVYPNVSSFLAMSPTSPKSPTSVVDMPTSNSHSSTRDILNLERVPEENNDGSAMEILNLKCLPEENNDGSGNGAPEDSDAPDVKEEDVRGSVTSSP